MKKAVIEIGSNSIRYLFGEKINNTVDIITEKRIITRLRDSVAKTGKITEKNLLNTSKCLKKFITDAHKRKADKIQIIATDVLRKAANRDDVTDFLKNETGYDIKILSQEEEAHLAFFGATNQARTDKNFLVVDIGGGSTETVYSVSGNIAYAKSLELGAIRLSEDFFTQIPPAPEEIQKLNTHITTKIHSLKKPADKFTLIVVGGTATTISCVLMQKEYCTRAINDFAIEKNNLLTLTEKIKKMNNKEIESLPGMEKKKSDIILAGISILNNIMLHFDITTAYPKTTGVLYGCLLQKETLSTLSEEKQ